MTKTELDTFIRRIQQAPSVDALRALEPELKRASPSPHEYQALSEAWIQRCRELPV